MIYRASPYAHPDPAVREARYQAACAATAALIRDGKTVYSPIVNSHVLVEHGLPTDWESWARFDRDIIRRCDSLLVLMLDGWSNSVGVRAEEGIATACGIPIGYIHPTTLLGVPVTNLEAVL